MNINRQTCLLTRDHRARKLPPLTLMHEFGADPYTSMNTRHMGIGFHVYVLCFKGQLGNHSVMI